MWQTDGRRSGAVPGGSGNSPERRVRPALPDQVGIWLDLEHRVAPHAYNIGGIAWFDAELRPDAFEQGLRLAMEWHEALRLRFLAVGDGLEQEVLPEVAPDLTVVDLSDAPDPEAAALDWFQALIDRPFAIDRAPLCRHGLARLGQGRWGWAQAYHHLIADGWAISLLSRHIMQAHTALCRGETPVRPAFAKRYLDLAARLEDYRKTANYGRDAGYWVAMHSAMPPPLLSPRHAGGGRTGVATLALPQARYAEIQDFARRHGGTAAAFFLALFVVCLARSTGRWDMSIGLPTLNRPTVVHKETAGLFATVNPQRCRADPEMPFTGLMLRLAGELRRSYRHQRFPLADLQRLLIRAGEPRQDLYQVGFSFLSNDYNFSFADLPCRAEGLVSGAPSRPLEIFLRDFRRDQDVRLDFVHDTAFLDADEASRLAGRCDALLTAVLTDGNTPLKDLDVVPEAERRLVRALESGPAVPVLDVFAHRLVEAQARERPQADALLCGDARVSYGGLNATANRIARHLFARTGGDAPVGVCLERSVELVTALLAVLKASRAYVPLDPDLPAPRLAGMIADAGVGLVITLAGLADRLPAGTPLLRLDGEADAIDRMPADDLPDAPPPDAPAYIMFTSGSSGRPKGVEIAHRGLINRLLWMKEAFAVTPNDVFLQKTPAGFDVAVWELFLPLMAGARLAVAANGAHADPDLLATTIRRHGVTILHFVPSMLETFLRAGGAAACGRVRTTVCSGEALPPALAALHRALMPGTLSNLYGPTEATIDVTAYQCPPDRDIDSVPIGRPVWNTSAHVLDDRRRPVGIGMAGELYLGGVQLARGYAGRPDLTAERFVPDPFRPGERLYRTGDLARWRADGQLEHLGRADEQQVKLHGARIELGEIEAALERDPRVARAIARVWGEGERTRLVAYVVPRAGKDEGEGAAADWRAALAGELPAWMVPSAVVTLDRVPVTTNGKLDRAALPEPVPVPRPGIVPPRGPVEIAVARLFAELFDCGAVGADDDFLDLGGDSLAVIRLSGRIRQTFGVAVSLREIRSDGTVARLAQRIGALLSPAAEAGSPAGRRSPPPGPTDPAG